MKLLWSPRSPFARKVSIVLEECGLSEQVEKIESLAIFAALPNPDILRDNPLGKIPVLRTDKGEALFDSAVICEFLIERAGRFDLLPYEGASRIKHLRWQAMADGLTDILLLWRTERMRGDAASAVILQAFEIKTRAVLAQLDAESTELAGHPFGLGQIAVSCALGQLDFRYGDCGWRAALPKLAAWQSDMAKRPSIKSTVPVDDGSAPPSAIDATPAFTYEMPT